MQSLYKKDDYLNDFLFNRMSVVLVPFLLTNILYILPGFAEGRITSLYGLCTSILGRFRERKATQMNEKMDIVLFKSIFVHKK